MAKVLIIPFLFHGHLQIPYAIGKNLLFRDENTEIIFITDKTYEKVVKKKCSKFKTFTIETGDDESKVHNSIGSTDAWFSTDNKERYKNAGIDFGAIINVFKQNQDALVDAIHKIKPDLILVEVSFNLPFVMASGFPWVQMISTNPLKLGDQGTKHPPMGSGVVDDFKWYADVFKEKGKSHRILLDEWYKEFGLVRKPSLCHVQGSGEHFNVFLYPKMLNYFSPTELEGKWLQLNSTIVSDEVENFIESKGWVEKSEIAGLEILTPEFLSRPGKLIYFSLGTVVSNRLEVFKRFIPILAESKHKFVVSKGKFGNEIQFPENCVAANDLNQIEFFKSGLLDLCVIHGGNNSFTEACHFGLPMVIIPGFGDQFDNAIKAETNNLGKKVLLGDVPSKLNEAIEFVLNNESMKTKMKEISKDIQQDDTMNKLIDLITEKYLTKTQKTSQ